jgi:enamine deaminase RidA (YjgF/YER057c/UK114 family)
MSEQSGSGSTQVAIIDDVSRRRLVMGAAAVAALGATTAESLAQGALAAGAAANLRFIKPATSFNNPGFTHAVEAMGPGRLIYIAGQQGLDSNGKVVGAPGDFMAQAEQAFLNIKGILAASGTGFEHVVKLQHYFIDLKANFKSLRELRLKYFDAARMPASTMIQVGALTNDGVIYEVDAVAVVPMG